MNKAVERAQETIASTVTEAEAAIEAAAQEAEEYIAHIISLQSARTVDKRFYIMFEYEGDNGKFSRNFKEIWRSMKNTERDIRSKLVSTGNLVVSPKDENFHA